MTLEFAERIRRIPSYPLAAGYDLGAQTAMLASNESCFAPSPAVAEAAARALAGANRYPDPSYAALRGALADRYDLPPERIALGNGSCDILLAAGEALLEPGAELVYAWPAFSVYPHLAAASGARAIEVPLDSEDRHDLDAIASEVTVATRLVLVCNPNNPTSTAVSLEAIASFLERIPRHVCVILDEAYVEFSLTVGDTYSSVDLFQGLRPRRAAGRLRAVRLRGVPVSRRSGAPAVLSQRRSAGGRGRGASPSGRRGTARNARRRGPAAARRGVASA